jgi:hypothetical protein
VTLAALPKQCQQVLLAPPARQATRDAARQAEAIR